MSRKVSLVLLVVFSLGIGAANAQKLETGVIKNVGSTFQTVTLPQSYASMVVVCTPVYTGADEPAVVRVQNATGNSFEVRVQNTSNTVLTDYAVHYMVVEEGVYTEAVHGVKMEAVKALSVLTARSGSWVFEPRTYQQAYTSPVVVGQVMTQNDFNWSVFWSSDGLAADAPPSATGLACGKHNGQDDVNVTRLDETIGYIVIEEGSGTIDGIDYVAAVGPDIIEGIQEAPAPWTYSLAPLGIATEVIAVETAQDGGDGSWMVLYGPYPIVGANVDLAQDEDQIRDTERDHTNDQAAFIAFNRGLEAYVTRTVDRGFIPDVQPGQATLTATNVGGWTQVTVVETLPTGVTAPPAGLVASSGTATAAGQTITWDVTLGAGESATLTYDAAVDGAIICRVDVQLAGTYTNNGVTGDIVGDFIMTQTPQDFRDAPIPWAGSVDIPSGLTPAGRTDYYACNESYTLWGDGGDIWNQGDEFHFLYVWAQGDFSISAQVLHELPQANGWEKAGVMVRPNLTPGSPFVDNILRSNVGGGNEDWIYAQERESQDVGAQRFDQPNVGTAGSQAANDDDAIVGIRRQGGGTFIEVFYDTLDPANGAAIPWYGADRPNIPNGQPILLGLCYTSHSSGNIEHAEFWNVDISATTIFQSTADVNRSIPAGYPIGGSVDIIVIADGLLDGAISVVENVPTSLTISNIRTSLGTANQAGQSINWDVTLAAGTSQTLTYAVSVLGTPCRDTFALDGTYTMGPITAPILGDTLLDQASDGVAAAPVVWVDDIDIPPTIALPGWTDYYACDDTYILHAAGADIWGTADEFHFLYVVVQGDFQIQGLVDILPPNTNAWTKAGMMLRATLDPGSPHCLLATTNNGPGDPWLGNADLAFQHRVDPGGASTYDNATEGAQNDDAVYFILRREGTTIYADYDDLETTILVPWLTYTHPNIDPAQPNLVGLALTSHNANRIANAMFQGVVVTGVVENPPSAPSNLSASGFGRDSILLTWRDNSFNEVGFKIERSINAPGTWTEIAQTGANMTSFIDSGLLTDGTVYYYRVRAFNGAGDSAYSNTASSTAGQVLDATRWTLYR